MKKISNSFLLFLLCFSTFLNAQGWEKIYEIGVNNSAYNIVAEVTPDNKVIMAGSQSTINPAINAFIYKIDEDGNLVSELNDLNDGTTEGFYSDLIVTADENYLTVSNFSNNSPGEDPYYLQKLMPDGTEIWKVAIDTSFINVSFKVIESPSNEYFLVGAKSSNGSSGIPFSSIATKIVKYDILGNEIWQKEYSFPNEATLATDFIFASNGDIILLNNSVDLMTVNYDLQVARLNYDGDVIWENEYYNIGQFDIASAIVEFPSGEFAVSGTRGDPNPNNNFILTTLLKIDANGNKLWDKTYSFGEHSTITRDLILTEDNGLALTGSYKKSNFLSWDIFLLKVDSSGNELWMKGYGSSNVEDVVDIMPAPNQGFFLSGISREVGGNTLPLLIRTDSLGNTLTNYINGNLYFDENVNCNLESNEVGLEQSLIEATKGDVTYYSLTDSLGNYEFTLDTGSYNVIAYQSTPYWENCIDNFTVNFANPLDTFTQNIGAEAIIDCPLLNISIGTPLLRRCFENIYTVQYCNYGTITAEDAYAEISLDPEMILQSTSIPITAQMGNTLTFDLGDVPINDCGSFTVNVLLGDSTSCDSIPLGATHCVEAHIFPDSICLPNNNWSGASIEVDAICDVDSIFFFIQNVGTATSQTNLQYIVIEDDVILFDGNFTLAPNETETVSVATNGATFRLEAEQEPNHPGMSMPSVTVEGCGTLNTIFNFGFVNIFIQDDGDPFVDIDCQNNLGSFDPNDKQGYPLGHGAENYISKGQDIEYQIRFQNTGTDTAFTVEILDELSELLDITTIRPGAASHSYTFDIVGDRVLSFKFDNIMLPDSNVNEVASHGFVKFKVSQMPDLDLETQIFNSAAIYFDFNSPIITNQTLHTIGEEYFVTLTVDPKLTPLPTTNIFPNPFSDYTNIEIEGVNIKIGGFRLFDATGRLLRNQTFYNNTFTFYKKSLNAGMYFFRIENEGQIIANGKLIIQ